MNRLYYGDNLKVMKGLASESIDLIYLDPPFNSGRNYNLIYREENGKTSQAQASAFNDTWKWEHEAKALREAIVQYDEDRRQYGSTVTKEGIPSSVVIFLGGMERILGDTPMHAYLVNMAPRLVEMYRLLKGTGSIYLHCDPTASHYLKILMDAVFEAENFRNEIVWFYPDSPGRPTKDFPRKHDTILRFTKSKEWTFNDEAIRVPILEASVERYKTARVIAGHTYVGGKAVEIGKIPEDVWRIPVIKQNSKQALGYQTQKPEALLERIIKVSCPKDGIVLDPFCGCGTTVTVAERLGIRWIGIDITHLAIGVIKKRLREAHGEALRPYQVIGDPVDLEGVRTLAKDSKFEFQCWAVDRVGGLVSGDRNRKGSGPDRGVDGIIPFGEDQRVVLQVKGGTLKADDVRALSSVVDHEKAAIGMLVALERPTKGMVGYAEDQGQYEWKDPKGYTEKYPKIQILTIEEILAGKAVQYPRYAKRETKASPAKAMESKGRQASLEVK